MRKTVECVPNISEGKDGAVIKAVCDAVSTVKGVKLLHVTSDADHNRSVLTFKGSPRAVGAAAVALAVKAAELIDLTKQKGEHPRMGAADVIPFVPLKGATMEDCVSLSKRVGRRIWREAGVPVFLYEYAATAGNRKNLADVRRGQFEGMPEKLLQKEWKPDFGKRKVHPTAGVVAVGARKPLIAYNLVLNTPDVAVASDIASVIREKNGGLKCVKALGVFLADRGLAQVTCNLTDYKTTSVLKVTETVKKEAAKRGFEVADTEIVGMVPRDALPENAVKTLGLRNFDEKKQILDI